MKVTVQFWSYCRDLTGHAEQTVEISEGATTGDLLRELYRSFPKLAGLDHSLLIAVGVEYQGRSYVLRPGDRVSLFPPVQGG